MWHCFRGGISRFTPIPISALSGTGTGELLDLVCSGLNKLEVCIGFLFFRKTLVQEYKILAKIVDYDISRLYMDIFCITVNCF